MGQRLVAYGRDRVLVLKTAMNCRLSIAAGRVLLGRGGRASREAEIIINRHSAIGNRL
jgi:hypothetical protein